MESIRRSVGWVGKFKKKKNKGDGALGFCDLHAFNLTFLIKQAWSLIQNPRILWVRLLKVLYFPNASFLEALERLHHPWVWSILRGRSILIKGSRWQMENEKGH